MTDVNVFHGEHREPKFIAMNPHEEVPILADGKTTIFGGFVLLCALLSLVCFVLLTCLLVEVDYLCFSGLLKQLHK